MEHKLKEMYRSGGLMKALLKDPKQRKMAEDILGKAEMGMKVFGHGGTHGKGPMKYRMGGMYDKMAMGGMQEKMAMGGMQKKMPMGGMQDKMAMGGMQDKMAMGGMKMYGHGGMHMYGHGGMHDNDGEPVSELTEMETERIVKNPTNMGFEFVGQDYLEQLPETIKEPRDLLRFFVVKEAARLLDGVDGISTRGMKPQDILNAARQKGINPLTSARELFDIEMDKRSK
tara:strand:+ start:1854 stop:2537 length:684 start_codon:yes stop_codon:yes gene_type:complete